MRLILIISVILSSLPSFAQFNSTIVYSDQQATSLVFVPSPIKSRPVPGIRMKNVGTALTVSGVFLLITGVAILSSVKTSPVTPSPNGTQQQQPGSDPKLLLGSTLAVGGIGLAIPGIILWAKGSKKYNRGHRGRSQINFNGNGMSLSYKL
jgi:hypothetical protein